MCVWLAQLSLQQSCRQTVGYPHAANNFMRYPHFVFPCLFRRAIEQVHRALDAAQLEVASEWDIAYDIRTAMGTIVPPSRAILVFDPVQLTKRTLLSPGAAFLASVPLQLNEENGQTSVWLLPHGNPPSWRRRLVEALQTQVAVEVKAA